MAMTYYQDQDGAIDKRAPVGFLTPRELAAVTRDNTFRVSLYKALLFIHVQSGLKSGTLNLQHSHKYRPLDAYLIDRDRWQRDKGALIARAGLQEFVDPHRVLAQLDEALTQQYGLTNAHIAPGQNPYIKFTKTGFTVATPKQEASHAGPLQQYFPNRDVVPLLELLATVNRHIRLDGGVPALAASVPSRRTTRPGRLRWPHCPGVRHWPTQDGAHISPCERSRAGQYGQLVFLAR